MRATLLAALICLAASQAHAGACLLKREQASGSFKVCWYGCGLGEFALTVKATRLCKLMIERDDHDRMKP